MKQLRILAPTRYPWRFNSARQSVHKIENRNFVPFNKIDGRYEGFTVFNPLPPARFDLVHAFNRLPIGTTPYVIGFESHLPRAFGQEDALPYRLMLASLASDRCRRIIAISDYARRIFIDQHRDSPHLPALENKLEVRFPNMPARTPFEDAAGSISDGPVRIVFVGGHFGRKGGCVAVRLAQIAASRSLDVRIDIVSSLEVGGAIWTDPSDPAFFAPYLAQLDRPNIVVHKKLDNLAVLRLFRNAHFSLLTTLCDTFGYSAFESMTQFTPVIATRQGALPEFIVDGENGILLDLETDRFGDWIHSNSPRRDTAEFARLFAEAVERLAEDTLTRIVDLVARPADYVAMRRAAKTTAISCFDAEAANTYWDNIYSDAVAA